jgi:hypothetical protein
MSLTGDVLMNRSKDEVAEALAQAHYAVEAGVLRVVRLVAAPQQESDPREPIKLLEVNENTTAEGIRPIYFGARPASGITYPSVIIEVTPEEFDQIRQDPSLLPNEWRLGDEYPKVPAAVGL